MRALLSLLISVALCGPAAAQSTGSGQRAPTAFQPAVLYDIGGRFDKSINEGVATGVKLFADKTGIEFREFDVTVDTQREQALRNMARRGDNPILAAGAANAAAVEAVAREFPATRFAIIDGMAAGQNVQSIVFRDQEGAFLVGALAAMASRSGKVGFVGAVDLPRTRRIACGYTQGAKQINPEIGVLKNMAGTTPAAWSDPGKGAELAKAQFDRGVDVVFHAAGGTGLGVLQAAADAQKFAIGSEYNQNGLHPGFVLTSMLRRIDIATFNMFKTAAEGTWRPGLLSLGVKEGGVNWTLDDNNGHLVGKEARATMERLMAGVASGEIAVHDFLQTNDCPF